MGLPNRAREYGLLPGPDHHLGCVRDIILVVAIAGRCLLRNFGDPGIGGHGDNRLDRAIVDFLPLFQTVVYPRQYIARLGNGLFLALDFQLRSPCRDIDAKTVLDRHDIPVIFPEQIAQNLRIVKFEIQFDELSRRRGFCFLDHQAASLSLI